jgi:alkylation response protein AidB-like acyl-CoA dehydrogenase
VDRAPTSPIAVIDGSPELPSDIRSKIRRFLEANVPRRRPAIDDLGVSTGGVHDSSPDVVKMVRSYQAALFDAGLAGLTWPIEYGGQGLSAEAQKIFNEEASDFDVPTRVVGIGLGMCGPTILAHGTEEQRERFIRPMLRGDEIWCQLFSEPGAGSDIAAVQTRAVRDGDTWVVDGQKVWSSVAHHSDWGLALVRTDFDAPKHDGLTMMIIDMRSPGVEVRPLRQMDGGANFNEVFFTNVSVPAGRIVGQVNDGWKVARTTLTSERYAVSGGRQGNTSVAAPVLRLVTDLGVSPSATMRQQLAELYTIDFVLRQLQERARHSRERGRPVGPEGSVAKLLNSRLQKMAHELRLAALGASGMASEPDDALTGGLISGFVGSPAASIGGGTDEVQKNIIGERVLGLPRESSADGRRPFRELVQRAASASDESTPGVGR